MSSANAFIYSFDVKCLVMNELEIAHVFGEKTFNRGKTYFEEGRVLSAIMLKGKVVGEVLGTEKYFTRATLDDLDSDCTCPMKINCKHGAALLLQFLSGNYLNGDQIMNELEGAKRLEVLHTLKSLINDDPTLLFSLQEIRKEPSAELKSAVEKQIKRMLDQVVNDGYADEDFAEALAKLIKNHKVALDKESIFYVLEFLIKNCEDYGNFYNHHRDDYFGEEIFENLCDAFSAKSLEANDFKRLKNIIHEDDYATMDSFLTRIITPENASKLKAFGDQVRELLGDDALYAKFLLNAKENDKAKRILRTSKELNEDQRFNLYLNIDKTEALELAKKRKYYSSLIRYYQTNNANKDVIATFISALNENAKLDSSPQLYECVLTSILKTNPENSKDLLQKLFKICDSLKHYDLCVDIGIELKNPNMLKKFTDQKPDHGFTSHSKIKLLKFIALAEPETAKKSLKTFAEELINIKEDYAYEKAVSCILALRELLNKQEWIDYLKNLYTSHYRKLNLWRKIKDEGITVKRDKNTLIIS